MQLVYSDLAPRTNPPESIVMISTLIASDCLRRRYARSLSPRLLFALIAFWRCLDVLERLCQQHDVFQESERIVKTGSQ